MYLVVLCVNHFVLLLLCSLYKIVTTTDLGQNEIYQAYSFTCYIVSSVCQLPHSLVGLV